MEGSIEGSHDGRHLSQRDTLTRIRTPLCRTRLRRLSMGTVGECYGNAPIERFCARMQTELLNTRKWATVEQLSVAIAAYIENCHNMRRRHSLLDLLIRPKFETLTTPQLHHT